MNDLISIPAGEYSIGLDRETIESFSAGLAGSPVRKEFLYGSFPRQTVRLDSYCMGRSPVTGDEFARFVADTGYVTEAERDGWGWVWEGSWLRRDGASWRSPGGAAGDGIDAGELPVMQVSWNDAAGYCRWLSEATRSAVRLPREAEWEVFAERAGAGKAGGEGAPLRGEFLDALRAHSRTGRGPGIGLVWEWTDDWYDRYPGGPENRDFGTIYKVLRGGSLSSHPVQRIREYRLRKCPTARSPYYGFRIARSDGHV